MILGSRESLGRTRWTHTVEEQTRRIAQGSSLSDNPVKLKLAEAAPSLGRLKAPGKPSKGQVTEESRRARSPSRRCDSSGATAGQDGRECTNDGRQHVQHPGKQVWGFNRSDSLLARTRKLFLVRNKC